MRATFEPILLHHRCACIAPSRCAILLILTLPFLIKEGSSVCDPSFDRHSLLSMCAQAESEALELFLVVAKRIEWFENGVRSPYLSNGRSSP